MKHTYTHRFTDGKTSATITLDTATPGFAVQWHGKPTPSLVAEYLAWRNECVEHFAKESGLRILLVTV